MGDGIPGAAINQSSVSNIFYIDNLIRTEGYVGHLSYFLSIFKINLKNIIISIKSNL